MNSLELSRPMTPEQIKRARKALNLSTTGLERLLGLKGNGGRVVRRWEAGKRDISGTCDLLIKIALFHGVEFIEEVLEREGVGLVSNEARLDG